jgi:hypothetical protein
MRCERGQGLPTEAMKGQRIPTKITLDAYATFHRAVADLKGERGTAKAGAAPQQ